MAQRPEPPKRGDERQKPASGKLEEATARFSHLMEQAASWPQRRAAAEKARRAREIPYATLNDRVFASVIDIVLSTALFAPLMLRLSGALRGGDSAVHPLAGLPGDAPPEQVLAHLQQSGALNALLLDYSVHFALFGIIVLWLWNRSSATPGKWLLRLRIVDEETFCRPSPRQFFIRYLGYIPSILPLTLGFIWVLIDSKRRAWHDIMAGTVVVRVKHWRFRDDGITPHIVPPSGNDEAGSDA